MTDRPTAARGPFPVASWPAEPKVSLENAPSGLAAIAAVSKLPEAELLKIWDEVQANSQRLNLCRGHSFSESLDAPGTRVRRRWRCVNCQGTADGSAKFWYEAGLAHGRGGMRT